MSNENIITERVDDRIGRVRDWVGVQEQDGLGCHELLPLRATRTVDPAGKARDAVAHVDRELLTAVARRWGWRRSRAVDRDLGRGGDRVEQTDSVSPGADSRVTDLGEHAGFKILVEWLWPAWGKWGFGRGSDPPVHGKKRERRDSSFQRELMR